jgi:hypothetical protein
MLCWREKNPPMYSRRVAPLDRVLCALALGRLRILSPLFSPIVVVKSSWSCPPGNKNGKSPCLAGWLAAAAAAEYNIALLLLLLSLSIGRPFSWTASTSVVVVVVVPRARAVTGHGDVAVSRCSGWLLFVGQ